MLKNDHLHVLICVSPQCPLSPRGSRVRRLPLRSRRVAPPARAPLAARRSSPPRGAPPRRALRLRRREVSRRARRTHQGAAGERSPRGTRERRARVSRRGATRTLTTATTIPFSSHPQGSEDRGRGTFSNMHFSSSGYDIRGFFCDSLPLIVLLYMHI